MGNSSAAGFAAAVIAIGTMTASATTYNAVTDFSAGQTGAWSYFGRLDGGAPIPLAKSDCGGPAGVTCVSNGAAPPNRISIANNASGTPWVAGNALDLDPQSGTAILRWTAPAAGLYDIAGSFAADDTNETAHDVSILDSTNPAPLLGPTLLSTYHAVTSFNFDDLRFASGDFIDFMTAATADGAALTSGFLDLPTGLQATITPQTMIPGPDALDTSPPDPVPEPGSLVLLASAVLGIGLARKLRGRPAV